MAQFSGSGARMFFAMYGIGCGFCGHPVTLWRDRRLWPCGCQLPGRFDDTPPAPREAAVDPAVVRARVPDQLTPVAA